MSKKHRVLVFPCGSECGLEIGRSLRHLKEIDLWGGSSVDDHGKFAFKNYIGGIPFATAPNFISHMRDVAAANKMDFIYPAMDLVIDVLANSPVDLGAEVVGSCAETASIALSKKKTYEILKETVRCPEVYSVSDLTDSTLPVFLKPEIGYGSKGTFLARSVSEVENALSADPTLLILEYFPGEEYTVDCFTDFNGKLHFAGGRQRNRIAKGISVNTQNVPSLAVTFQHLAEAINEKIRFNGGWFFQVKRTTDNEFGLLEVAPRIAGSMGLHRYKGVNIPLLSVLNQAKLPVGVLPNNHDIELDRALYSKVRLTTKIEHLFLDFDDCILLDEDRLNAELIKLVVQCRNREVNVSVISRHDGDLIAKLKTLGIHDLFDDVIHIVDGRPKSEFMNAENSFLIDDSFRERQDAAAKGIPSLGPESVDALLE
jgi:hypothetical protein